MKKLIVILGDQLSLSLASLQNQNPNHCHILMAEVYQEATYVAHHKKKIAFIFSAMRHFKNTLVEKGYHVIYRQFDDEQNTGDLSSELTSLLKQNTYSEICITEPGEYRVLEIIKSWEKRFSIPVNIQADTRFYCTLAEFAEFAKDKKQLRMEFFYRNIRKKYNILMQDQQPLGGKWNYDAQNRNPLKKDIVIPDPLSFKPDGITNEVIKMVEKHFDQHFGDIHPFYFACTQEDAKKVLNTFIQERLPLFGQYQDAMKQGQAWLFHSHISFYLNCGLLLAKDCVQAALTAYEKGHAGLESVEGFIRQVIGWREFIRGIYWLKMPEYKKGNALAADKNLPAFFWHTETRLNCLKQCLSETKTYAYNHHIQRLMVLGNFLLLAGIKPQEVQDWYLAVYADAYEWVELPNVMGMILFADDGVFASKPYAASGSYINKMSNYCKHCEYNVKEKDTDRACPFNYLYWHFLNKHHEIFKNNPRMTMIYRVYEKMNETSKKNMKEKAEKFLANL